MNRTTRRLAIYYTAALVTVVVAVIAGLILSAQVAHGASWERRCSTPSSAAAIATGTPRHEVQLRTGRGVKLWTDSRTIGKQYGTCNSADTLAVVYDRATDAVLSVIYVHPRA